MPWKSSSSSRVSRPRIGRGSGSAEGEALKERTVGLVSVVVGVLLVLLGLTADAIGVGASPGVGAWQIAVLAIGAILLVFGALRLRARSTPAP